jgi:hypothetical protein
MNSQGEGYWCPSRIKYPGGFPGYKTQVPFLENPGDVPGYRIQVCFMSKIP